MITLWVRRAAIAWAALSAFTPGMAPAASAAAEPEWVSLFDGQSLDGWTAKIRGRELGDNFADTFRVRDGLLVVSYDGYEQFDNQFGHLFYQTPYAYYRLRLEYRFVGEQAPGGPGDWAVRNSGVMVHSQPPETMTLDQPFPVSIEAQFLGGLSDGQPRPTANVCTPGTEIVVDQALYPEHCLNADAPTIDGDAWVTVEVEVLGGARIRHFVDGEEVISYALPQLGGWGGETLDPARRGELLNSGYLTLQSESHPIEFRRIEILDLEGCLDPAASNYQAHVVRARPGACRYPDTSDATPASAASTERNP